MSAPILLVHGAWHGPWCWDDFAHQLTERGHRVRAMQLRGHDRRPGRLWYAVSHYLEDVRRAAADFDEPPVLVGHSLGGLLVQQHLARHPAAGAVLMASVPPRGALSALGRIALRHPLVFLKANALLSLRPFISSRSMVRELYFGPQTPQHLVEGCMEFLQNESFLVFLQVLKVRWCAPFTRVPVLVLGAVNDGFFTVAEVEKTAHAYSTAAEIFPMGHDMMLDVGWQRVADRVDDWVRSIAETSPVARDRRLQAPTISGTAGTRVARDGRQTRDPSTRSTAAGVWVAGRRHA